MKDKSSINSRYSIEYSQPDTSRDSSVTFNKKWPLIILGVLAVAGLSSAIIPFKSVQTFLESKLESINHQEPLASTGKKEDTIEVIDEEYSAVDESLTIKEPSASDSTSAIETQLAIEEQIVKSEEPTVIKGDQLTEVLNDLNSDLLVEVSTSSIPEIEEVEVAESEKVVEVIEIDVEKLLLDNRKHQEASQEQLRANQELTQKLNELSKQLMAEKNKNEKLNAQISAHESNNSKLASLLDSALTNASNEDQQYIAELNNLNSDIEVSSSEENQQNETNLSAANINSDVTAINDQVAKLVPTVSSVKIDYNNSIGVSTATQIDAILLAMQEIQQSNIGFTKRNTKSEKNIVSADAIVVASSDQIEESLFVKLQNEINQLLESDIPKLTTYKEALKKESDVRVNAMRSIIVKKGETLWSIAQRAYGNGSLYTKIIEANPHISKNGKIVLSIGQVIRVPI